MINYQIKDNSLIKKSTQNKEGGKDFVLSYGTYLSDVIENIPNGRIDKRETGIGATTLELSSKRNSIIVQPLRITAESKAEGKPDVFYFGNNRKRTTGRIRTFGIDKEIELREYIRNQDWEFKKISVVADSLPKLIDELESIGVDVLGSYFLLIDEIDSIQKDSSFRNRMEPCMNIYKLFPNESRAVISATLLNFSDPDLSKEPLTTFKYDQHTKGYVNLYNCPKILESSSEIISNLIKYGDKLLIAINSLNDILILSKYLTEGNHCSYDDMTVLCGQNTDNQKKIRDFKQGEIVNGKLPNKINFITSAYFTGYDIKDKIRLLIISDSSKSNTILSEHEIYQITGRCRDRKNIIGIDILFNIKKKDEKLYSDKDCLDLAQRSLKSLNCLKSNFTGSSLNLKSEIEIMKKFSEVNIIDEFSFVKTSNTGETYITYLNIDAFLEKQRVSNTVYLSPNYLKSFLSKNGFLVQQKNHVSKITLDKKLEGTNKESLLDAIQFILSSNRITTSSLSNYLNKNKDLMSKRVLGFYEDARMKKVKKAKIDEWLNDIKTVNSFNKLEEKFNVHFNEDTRVKKLFKKYLILGQVYSKQDLNNIMKEVFCEMLMIIKEEQFNFSKAKNVLENHAALKRVQKTIKNKKVDHYKVLNFNPLNL